MMEDRLKYSLVKNAKIFLFAGGGSTGWQSRSLVCWIPCCLVDCVNTLLVGWLAAWMMVGWLVGWFLKLCYWVLDLPWFLSTFLFFCLLHKVFEVFE
jgi:hypothetical protein